MENGNAFDITVNTNDKYYGTSYLEGGNVLNTKLKDGTSAAIVGEGSIGMTLEVMGLEKTPENIKTVKKQIATDLGLEEDQVTFIPQHEFHIDMIYRPLHNGEVAIPDYEQGIAVLKNLRDEVQQSFTEQSDSTSHQKILTQRKLHKLNKQIDQLQELSDNTKELRQEANDNLTAAGYKIVKLPCFTANSNDKTNFMNGVGGTSAKTGQTFYITNKSEFPELESVIEESLKKAGIDKVYFVSTQHALSSKGGLDCLTQEK